jgi:hypothetical protein
MELMQQKTDNYFGQTVVKEGDRNPSPDLSSEDQYSDDSQFSEEERKIPGDHQLKL